MTVELLPDELRELLLVRVESEDVDYVRHTAPCYGLSWDKRRQLWIVRINNKKVMEISESHVPEDFDIRSQEFVNHILSILRDGGQDGLKVHLEELKCASL